MKKGSIGIFCVLMFFVVLITPNQIRGQAGAMTIGSLILGLDGFVKTLKESAESLLDRGDVIGAHQQMLLAATIENSINAIKNTYAESLKLTFKELNASEEMVFKDVNSLFSQVQDIVQRGGDVASSVIYSAQTSANQLMDRIPLLRRSPVFHGLVVNANNDPATPNPADLEIFGFFLTDESLNWKKPDISINGMPIDANMISATYNKVTIQLSDEIKNQIGFHNTGCERLNTFQMEMSVHYVERERVLWVFPWNTTKLAKFSARALAAKPRFTVRVTLGRPNRRKSFDRILTPDTGNQCSYPSKMAHLRAFRI